MLAEIVTDKGSLAQYGTTITTPRLEKQQKWGGVEYSGEGQVKPIVFMRNMKLSIKNGPVAKNAQ